MKAFLYYCMLALASFGIQTLYAGEVERGQQLHDQYCTQCHSVDIYTRENSIISDYRDLELRIRQCELSNELTWFDEDINAVLAYLNNNFYRFETPPKE
jgi:cytochrome c553